MADEGLGASDCGVGRGADNLTEGGGGGGGAELIAALLPVSFAGIVAVWAPTDISSSGGRLKLTAGTGTNEMPVTFSGTDTGAESEGA